MKKIYSIWKKYKRKKDIKKHFNSISKTRDWVY